MKYVQISILILFIALNLFAPSSCLETKSSFRENSNNAVSELERLQIKNTGEPPKTSQNFDLRIPNAEVYFQGWVRYYHYSLATSDHIKEPRLFFQNNRFFSQRIKKPTHKSKDKHGLRAIPNKAAYFAVLYKDNLAIFDSRHDILTKQVDNLQIKYLADIPEDDLFKGSVTNMGDFPTGSCVDIEARIPHAFKGAKVKNYWIVCFDSPKDKGKFMTTLVKLRVKFQHKRNPIPVTKHSKGKHDKHAMAAATKKEGASATTILDGYWIMLQNWTSCSLKCGGGKSYQHWMCNPPKNGGKPCKGKAVRSRPCNTQPCPSPKTLVAQAKATKGQNKGVRKPIMRVGRFSRRPQKFSKCLLKENDAFLTTFNKKGDIVKKRPVRILMNNQTISLFKDDDYEDLLQSFNLQKTEFMITKLTNCCFTIQDNEKQSSICGYPENCGADKKKNQWASQWSKDYYLFKVLCRTGREANLITPEDLQEISDDPNAEHNGLDIDVVIKRKKKIIEEIHAEENQKFTKNIAQTQELGFKAIAREINIEKLVKKEEEAKEEQELKVLEKKVKAEAKKAECLHQQIQEKDYDTQFEDNMDQVEEMARLKEKISKKVEDSRNRIKKLLGKMRKKAARKKGALQQQLKSIRAKMAKEILLANKEGDIKKCIRGKKDLDFRTNYCNQNFVDDYVLNSACKSNDEFCYTCCEHEFGGAYRGKRNRCYEMCDEKAKKKAAAKKNAAKGKKDGAYQWLWAPQQVVKG